MKIIWPQYGFEFLVQKNGLFAVRDSIKNLEDKILYLNTLSMLNVDFINAPINIVNGNPLGQKVMYVVMNNKQLNLTTDTAVYIPKYTEIVNPPNPKIFYASKKKKKIETSKSIDLQ